MQRRMRNQAIIKHDVEGGVSGFVRAIHHGFRRSCQKFERDVKNGAVYAQNGPEFG